MLCLHILLEREQHQFRQNNCKRQEICLSINNKQQNVSATEIVEQCNIWVEYIKISTISSSVGAFIYNLDTKYGRLFEGRLFKEIMVFNLCSYWIHMTFDNIPCNERTSKVRPENVINPLNEHSSGINDTLMTIFTRKNV